MTNNGNENVVNEEKLSEEELHNILKSEITNLN